MPSAACMGCGMGRGAPRMMAVTSAAHMSQACCRHCGSCKVWQWRAGEGRRLRLVCLAFQVLASTPFQPCRNPSGMHVQPTDFPKAGQAID